MRAIDLEFLRCPQTGLPLKLVQSSDAAPEIIALETMDGTHRYPVVSGIPWLLPDQLAASSEAQQKHYANISEVYCDVRRHKDFSKLIWASLDSLLLQASGETQGKNVLEVCCGSGVFLMDYHQNASHRIGLDISPVMLESNGIGDEITLLCGDALRLPLADAAFDLVYVHGAVHHVPDRARLYAEFQRVLKPGGRFACLEPLDDFAPARWLRALIYHFSPFLDPTNEHPLRTHSTREELAKAGFCDFDAKPCGYLAFGLFANSDVMGFMRGFDRIPFHDQIAAGLVGLDELWRKIPLLNQMALQAVFSATKKC